MKPTTIKLLPAVLMLFVVALSGCERSENRNQNEELNNISWVVMHYSLGSNNTVIGATTLYYFVNGDSTVSSNAYKKLYYYNDEQHTQSIYEGLIRKSNNKMYFIPRAETREYTLYDFSLQEGDSFDYNYYDNSNSETHTVRLAVKKVEYINLLGNNIKQIEMASPHSDAIVFDTWYENIGSQKGLFNTIHMPKSGVGTIFLCAYKNNNLIYDNVHFDKCYYSDVDIEEVDSIFKTNKTFDL